MQITVRGSAEVAAPPQLAVLHLVVEMTGDDKKTVVSDAITGANQVRSGVDTLPQGTVSEFLLDPLRTSSWEPHDDRGQPLPTRHTATIPVRVTFTNFEELSRFAATQGIRPGVVLRRVGWKLTEEARTELEVRALAQAVASARTRAIIMASASGFSDVTPVAVSDPNLLDEPSPMPRGAMASPMMARESDGGGADLDPEALDLRPEDVVVRAQVDARFTAS